MPQLGMAAVRRFEDLRVWREARVLSALIDEACSIHPLRRNFGLADQMRRAAVSIVSNIAEGFDRRSAAAFRHFLLIAKGSAAELRAQLYLCQDRKYLPPAKLKPLYECAANVSRMLWGLITYLDACGGRTRTKQRGTRNAEQGTRTPRII
jgi:four helix bundle protein